jgi:translation initiation factor 2 subunit 3
MSSSNISFILNKQPIFNIGCLGSVADGKSTLVECLTGIKTQRHTNEKKRNITIKQGYGNMKIWLNDMEYHTTNSDYETYNDYELVNHISFVDCPGHQELIQTMLSSVTLMDGAIIVIAVNQSLYNKPQLIQHIAAAKLAKIKKIIICLNKIDLVSKEVVYERKRELDEILLKYNIEPYIIIPTSFNKKINLSYLVKTLMLLFNPLEHINSNNNLIFNISRSFDVNKAGTNWDNIVGGVVGGSLSSGCLKIGDEIEIRPGHVIKKNDKFICEPINTKILSIKTDNILLDTIYSGGLVGIGTDLDPFYSKNDKLVGNIIGIPGTLPSIYSNIILDTTLINDFGFEWIPKENDDIILQIGTKTFNGNVINIDNNNLSISLNKPICININQHIIICKNINNILKIVGEGYMKDGIILLK